VIEDRQALVERLLAEREAAQQELAIVSKREREVLVLLCKGCTNEEIAAALHLAVKTVELYRSSVRNRLGMSLFEAVALAVRAGWV
jgi:DNA-binding NarL/FixJ family response regulator